MADTGVVAGSPASRSARAVERLKTGAGVIAAVAGAVTGLWTIYEKVKADTRKITAASYDTLAPQLNEMSEALRQLHKENQELRQAMAGVSPEKAQAVVARAAAAGERPPVGRKAAAKPGTSGSPTASAGGAAPASPPAAPPPAQPAPPGAPPAPGTPPTTSPADPGGTPPPAAPPATAQAPPEGSDPLSDLLGTVARTREAVDKIRKVPETFDKVLENRKK